MTAEPRGRGQRALPLPACRLLFKQFFLDSCAEELRALLWKGEEQAHHGLAASLAELLRLQPALCNALLDEPLAVLPLAHDAARDALQATLAGGLAGPRPARGDAAREPTVKTHVRARFDAAQLAGSGPPWLSVRGLRDAHVGRLVCLAGSVARVGPPRLRQAARAASCSRCRATFLLALDAESGRPAQLPAGCPSCSGGKLSLDAAGAGSALSPQLCVDSAELLLTPTAGGPVCSGAAVTVVVEADLLHSAPAGEDVLLLGVVRRRWGCAPLPGGRGACELVLHCVSCSPVRARCGGALSSAAPPSAFTATQRAVEKDALAEWRAFWAAHAGAPLGGRACLVHALCPQLAGLGRPKLVVLLALCSGGDGDAASGRGESHVLLLGDPGTGKSQLLRSAARLSRRGVLAHGGGVTAAGLTCAAVRDAGGWAMEAGALVKAHRGVLALDEVDQLPLNLRGALHEALEQQHVSVAKAGVHVRLPCAATLVAACNARPGVPGGVLAHDLEAATSLAAPLLSRFDLVVRIADAVGAAGAAARDALHADAVLGLRRAAHDAAAAAAQAHSPAREGVPPPGAAAAAADGLEGEAWPSARLARYVAAVKDALPAPLGPDAERLVSAYYQAQRRGGAGRAAACSTPRLLEAAVRLTRAHARLMAHPVATRGDAVAALTLLRASLGCCGGGGGGGEEAEELEDPDAQAVRDQQQLYGELDAALGDAWRTAAVQGGGQEQEEGRGQAEAHAQDAHMQQELPQEQRMHLALPAEPQGGDGGGSQSDPSWGF